MKYPVKTFLYLLPLLFVLSCGDDPVIPPDTEPKPSTIKEGVSWSPEAADADKELTITFKAASTSPLFGYMGDVYLYAGVISEGQWIFQPSSWTDNNTKYKMTKVATNVWNIKLSSSIRHWFGSGTTPVTKLGIIVRSSDGTKKGINNDFFIPVTDGMYKPFQPGAVKTETLPAGVRHGINIVNNSTVTLVLYDKDKSGARKDFAHVIGDFNNWTLTNDEKSQMFRDETAGVWWITLTGLDAKKEYAFQYYVGKTGADPIRLADAYSRKILDPSNDQYIPSSTYPENKTYPSGGIGVVSVFNTRPDTYSWKVSDFRTPAPENLVVYEMLFRDFTATGDINGAMAKLDYLQSLGVNAIELMPVQEFDGNDSWGYNPAFFFAMDKAYGTDRMYKEFIDACHQRGIAVILDVVYNHATGANPFAKMWWDTANNRTAANNPYFNVTAPHPFSVFHDFNHSNQLVRDFVKRNLEFLLEEYNVDGFRFDLSKGFTQKQSSDDGVFRIYDPNRISYLKEYHSVIKAKKPDALVILEHFADDREETELGNAGMMVWRNMNDTYCQTAMGYPIDQNNPNRSDFSRTYYNANPPRPANSLVSYMESHDEERAAFKQVAFAQTPLHSDLTARMNQLATNAAFFFPVPGPKMVWQFGELGYDVSIDENGRTGKKPIKWDYYDVSQRKALHNTYAKLINLRKNHSELFTSTATLNWKVSASDWTGGRFLTLSSFGNSKQIVIVGNFTNTAMNASTTFPKTGTWYNYMNSSETLNVTSSTMNIAIPANSFRIYSTFAP